MKQFILWWLCNILVVRRTTGNAETRNVTLEETFFHSPGYDLGENYPDHVRTEYSFKSVYSNHALLLTVVEFELEAPTADSRCFDSLTIYDGISDNTAALYVLCGNISTDTTFITSWDTMYAIFSSDSLYTYKGFNISVVSQIPTTLSSTTSSTTSMTTAFPTRTTTKPILTPTSTTTKPGLSTTSTTTTPTVPTTSTSTAPTLPTTSTTTTPNVPSSPIPTAPTVPTTSTTTTPKELTTLTSTEPSPATTSTTTTSREPTSKLRPLCRPR